jgi:hypothetical protein
MEAVRTSETSVNFNVTTWRYSPEGSKLLTRLRENLKFHILASLITRCVLSAVVAALFNNPRIIVKEEKIVSLNDVACFLCR